MAHVVKVFLVSMLIIPAVAQAEEISIPLPELTGQYIARGGYSSKNAEVNCGIQFTDIQNVYIVCEGEQTAGIIRDVNDGQLSPVYGEFSFTIPSDTGNWYAYLSPFNQGLEMGCFTKSLFSNPTWDFFLDGRADIEASFGCIILGIYATVTPASCQISDMHLIIDGTVSPVDAIELLKPNTHQYLLSGSMYRIEWNDWRHYGSCSGDFQISYSLDDGENWIAVTESPVSNVCSYDWQVPVMMAENCLLKVEEINSSLTDTSDVPFSIYECLALSGDFTGDCVVNIRDFQAISEAWLEAGGYTITDLVSLAENWLGCRNPYNPDCEL